MPKRVKIVTAQSTPEMDAINAVVPGSGSGEDYAGKTVVISKRFYGSNHMYGSDDRRFFASGGFGCSPVAMGRAVVGYFLLDGETARLDRGDIEGIAVNPAQPEHEAKAAAWEKRHWA